MFADCYSCFALRCGKPVLGNKRDRECVLATAVIHMSVTPDDVSNRVRMAGLFQRLNTPDGLNAGEEVGPAIIYPWTMLRQFSLGDLCRHLSADANVAEPAL